MIGKRTFFSISAVARCVGNIVRIPLSLQPPFGFRAFGCYRIFHITLRRAASGQNQEKQ